MDKRLLFCLYCIFLFKFVASQNQVVKFRKFNRHVTPPCSLLPLPGTTRNLKEIFIGRCFYYIHYHPKRLKNCEFHDWLTQNEIFMKKSLGMTVGVYCRLLCYSIALI